MHLRLVSALLALGLLAAAPARAQDESVTSGALTATLTWEPADHGVKHVWLTIVRAGAPAFHQPIPSVVCDGCELSGNGADDVQLRDLDGDGENEVLVTGFTGDIEACCTLLGVFDYRPASGTYGQLTRDFGSSGYELEDLDGNGTLELVASDIRFDDRFTDHLFSFPPPQILEFERSQVTDVTKRFPSLIRANARRALTTIDHLKRRDARVGGVVSAYVADQYLLGRPAVGARELDRLLARKLVTRAFRRQLLRFLDRSGY